MLAVVDKIVLKIAKDFSTTPGPRSEREGAHSGFVFRTQYLLPKIKQAIQNDSVLLVDLDGTAGYGTSFLEESFGGLIREDKISFSDIEKHMEFKSDEEPYLIEDIMEYFNDANERQ